MLNLPRLAFKSRVLTGCSGSVLHQPNFEARRDLSQSLSPQSQPLKVRKLSRGCFNKGLLGDRTQLPSGGL